MNPYNWQSHRPRIEIPRAAVGRVAASLREGGGAVEPFGLTFELRNVEGSPVTACFACTSEVAGMAVSVDHYLLRLPRRRKFEDSPNAKSADS